MTFFVAGRLKLNPKVLMIRLGYHQFANRESQVSYSRRLGTGNYPRFHVYLKLRNDGTEFSVHLDEKQPSYPGSHAHSGQYDGEIVEAEAERIQSYLASIS